MNDVSLKVQINSDWISVVCEELEIGGAGEDVVEAFTAFGRSYSSFYVSKAFADAASRIPAVMKSNPVVHIASHTALIDGSEKPRRGRPRIENPLSNAERKKRWRERHGDVARQKEREYVQKYRQKNSTIV